MKTLLLLAFMATTAVPNYVYPVRVQVLEGRRTQGRGEGRGNVYDQILGTRGFDFVYTGCWDFERSVGPDRYTGRWQAEQALVIVVHEVGSEKTQECTLHTTLRDFVYVAGKDGAPLTTRPLAHPAAH